MRAPADAPHLHTLSNRALACMSHMYPPSCPCIHVTHVHLTHIMCMTTLQPTCHQALPLPFQMHSLNTSQHSCTGVGLHITHHAAVLLACCVAAGTVPIRRLSTISHHAVQTKLCRAPGRIDQALPPPLGCTLPDPPREFETEFRALQHMPSPATTNKDWWCMELGHVHHPSVHSITWAPCQTGSPL
jgi:hypothetical protein